MGRADRLILGDWNVQCFQCGFKGKASEMEKNWQGYWVHPRHNEPRQPQDFVRGLPDIQTPPWTQPWPQVVYTYTDTTIGFGDGVTTLFQLGSGLYPATITAVNVNGTPVSWTDNGTGGITITAPASYAPVTASGQEIVTQ